MAKKEAGENPARSRRCKWEGNVRCHWGKPGKAAFPADHEPEDLPVKCSFRFHGLWKSEIYFCEATVKSDRQPERLAVLFIQRRS